MRIGGVHGHKSLKTLCINKMFIIRIYIAGIRKTGSPKITLMVIKLLSLSAE